MVRELTSSRLVTSAILPQLQGSVSRYVCTKALELLSTKLRIVLLSGCMTYIQYARTGG